MADRSIPAQDCVAAQRELFRLAERDYSLSIPVLAERNKHLRKTTMTAWREGAAMPAYAIGELKLAGVPDCLLSMLLTSFALAVIDTDDDDGDLDTAANDCLEFATEVLKARSRHSPGGPAIVPQEVAMIEPKRQRACSSIRRAAA